MSNPIKLIKFSTIKKKCLKVFLKKVIEFFHIKYHFLTLINEILCEIKIIYFHIISYHEINSQNFINQWLLFLYVMIVMLEMISKLINCGKRNDI
jgi:hypothetical protein